MGKDYFVNMRKKRKVQFLDFIKRNSDLSKRKLIGLFSHSTGLSVARLEIYYNELVDAELIKE